MAIRLKCVLLFLTILGLYPLLLTPALPQQKPSPSNGSDLKNLTLVKAVMCEGIQEFEPINEAIVFSISLGQVYCYSFFDPVPEKMDIYHTWYFQDRLTANIKLTLKPTSWKSYSTIQLREADKGPWRVEISDSKGRRLKVLRFSITE